MLATYLRGLELVKLPIAALFVTGRPFPLRIRLGDAGEAVAKSPASRSVPPSNVTLLEAIRLCESLGKVAAVAERRDDLARALSGVREP